MKRKFEWGAVAFTVCLIFVIRFGFLEGPAQFVYMDILWNSPLKNVSVYWRDHDKNTQISRPLGVSQVNDAASSPHEQLSLAPSCPSGSPDGFRSSQSSLGAWGGLKGILNRSDLAVEVEESFREGILAWQNLLPLVDEGGADESGNDDRSCPESVGSSNTTKDTVTLPCGLILDSSVTVVATPLVGSIDFHIELIGVNIPGDSGRPPVILHYNVRMQGDRVTDHPVIIHNTWTGGSEWGEEERCPSPVDSNPSAVDGFDRCVEQVGATWKPPTRNDTITNSWPGGRPPSRKSKPWFPFVEGMPFATTILAGWEGFHVTVNGKHISSFQYREGHEPSLVGRVQVRGDLQLSSIFAAGLPVSENMSGAEFLKSLPLPPKSKKIALFIGVFSSSNNFDRRMAQRKTWMQYEAVRTGDVVVRFFVGLHTQEQVNKELWEEANAFGDLQLLPFVDYYHLITLKTAAICIFVTDSVDADYVMKTDDDTFVRVDVILSLLRSRDSTKICLLGEVEAGSSPSRDKTSKWYISEEEWAPAEYPPWAHGPGYVFSSDIARFVSKVANSPQLKLFKLEDVAMGIWIDEFQQSQNNSVEYIHNDKFFSQGCEEDYVTAHYQTPRQMLCLWNHLQKNQKAVTRNIAPTSGVPGRLGTLVENIRRVLRQHVGNEIKQENCFE